MPSQTFYYDNAEGEGPSEESSHPVFVAHFTRNFYYDCTDDLSPFGNDTGAEILANLEDWYRDGDSRRSITKWLFETIDDFGFRFTCETIAPLATQEVIDYLEKEDPHFMPCMDQAILAAAFGQCKISGQINPQLLQLAFAALEREKMLVEKGGNTQFDTLLQFAQQEGTPEQIANLKALADRHALVYKKRLEEMEEDLKRFQKQERDSGSSPE